MLVGVNSTNYLNIAHRIVNSHIRKSVKLVLTERFANEIILLIRYQEQIYKYFGLDFTMPITSKTIKIMNKICDIELV